LFVSIVLYLLARTESFHEESASKVVAERVFSNDTN